MRVQSSSAQSVHFDRTRRIHRMHNRIANCREFSLTARAYGLAVTSWRNRGVTPGDFNERIGALLDRFLALPPRVICNFNWIFLPCRPPFAKGGEGGGRERRACLDGILKMQLTSLISCILLKFYRSIMLIIAYNEVVKVLEAFSRCPILLRIGVLSAERQRTYFLLD